MICFDLGNTLLAEAADEVCIAARHRLEDDEDAQFTLAFSSLQELTDMLALRSLIGFLNFLQIRNLIPDL